MVFGPLIQKPVVSRLKFYIKLRLVSIIALMKNASWLIREDATEYNPERWIEDMRSNNSDDATSNYACLAFLLVTAIL